MNGEIISGTEIVGSPEEIEGHDFRVPLIKWSGRNYRLYGLHLPYNWEKEIPRLSKENPKRDCDYLELLCQGEKLNWELHIDKKTGLITEIKLSNNKQASRVYLGTRFGRSGIYDGEDIQDLNTAVIYQDFLANYLSFLTNFEKSYSFIAGRRGNYCSVDLTVPQEIIGSEEPVTNEYYQRKFELKASNIAGQFGQTLKYVNFDEKGILQIIQIVSDKDCNYSLSSSFRAYLPHNVDSVYEAAALHGIGSEFINDLLKRKSREGWI